MIYCLPLQGRRRDLPKLKWFKGNIHTHTTESDGDDTPGNVVRWYRRHGYDFLVLSDHNHLTLFEYAEGRRRFKRPLTVPGEEVTLSIHEGRTPIHINAIGISRVVEPIDAKETVPTLQANVDAIIGAGGIASINHPNSRWSFDHDHIKEVTGATLLEIYNGHPASNVHGAPGKASYEEIWDGVLSAGRTIFGVATDDSHHYKDFHPARSNPGRGWIVVRAEALEVEAILDGLVPRQVLLVHGSRARRPRSVRRGSLPERQDREGLHLHHRLHRTRRQGPARIDRPRGLIRAQRGRGVRPRRRQKLLGHKGLDPASPDHLTNRAPDSLRSPQVYLENSPSGSAARVVVR